MKERISQLSRGFMLPISLLPIAGLFLGIGSGMHNIAVHQNLLSSNWFFTFTDFITSSGDVIFSNLPILFAVAIAITFTDDAGAAALTAVIGYLVFNGAQSTFITTHGDIGTTGTADVFWYKGLTGAVFTNNDGILSLQTSVFGGIVVGAISAVLYNKLHKIELHPIVSFFSGVRFVPIVTFLAVIPLAIVFLAIWPEIGKGLAAFGNDSAKWKGGMDSFAFGFIEKSLTPFGLHHAFYTPLWFSSAGGTLNAHTVAIHDGIFNVNGHSIHVHVGETMGQVLALAGFSETEVSKFSASGDINMWFLADNYLINFSNLKSVFGNNLGRFDQGQYTTMIFGLPAAAVAMIMTSKLEYRKETAGIVGSAALTSMLTGITEPIEFTFLFLAPILFWGFHAIMAALSFMLLSILGAHVGMTFSGGIIDWGLYGWLPFTQGTKPYMVLVIGLPLIPIYYFVFYWAIKKWDIQTPGRGEGDIEMITKDDYRLSKSQDSTNKLEIKLAETKEFIKALGGASNLKLVGACATRLRVALKDGSKIDAALFKKLGAFGIVGKGTNNVQVILGGKANVIKTRINEYISKKE